MKASIQHFENMLKIWQAVFDWLWLFSRAETGLLGVSQIAIDGPLVHAGRFRDYLLESFSRRAEGFDWTSFVTGTDPSVFRYLNENGLGGCFYLMPAEIHKWTISSRRFYTMTADLQALLALTNLEGVSWRDVQWPFDAFAVQLEIPIQGDNDALYDFLVFAKLKTPWDDKDKLVFHLYSTGMKGDVAPFPNAEKSQVESLLQAGRFQEAANKLYRINLGWHKERWLSTVLLVDEKDWDRDIVRHIRGYITDQAQPEYRHSDWDEAVRLIAGIAMYLRSLPLESPHRGQWVALRTGLKDPRALANAAEVCTVTTTFTLSAELRRAADLVKEKGLGRALRELGAHFRTGHWRRPPGRGQIPDAEKTVHVMPTIVRADRIAPGQLPPGAKAVLKK